MGIGTAFSMSDALVDDIFSCSYAQDQNGCEVDVMSTRSVFPDVEKTRLYNAMGNVDSSKLRWCNSKELREYAQRTSKRSDRKEVIRKSRQKGLQLCIKGVEEKN